LCTAVLVLRSPPRSMLFPYTTLFRSLIDCGEGTQLQLSRYGIKPSRIKHIFISHLHGDHYLGLVGLLSSMHLNGRREELFIYGRSEEHTSELQSRENLVCRLLLEKKK